MSGASCDGIWRRQSERSPLNLQSFLPEYQQKEINDVSWNYVEEEDEEVVHELAAAHVAIRIPYLSLERIVIKNLLSLLQYFSPSDRYRFALRYVVHWYIHRPKETRCMCKKQTLRKVSRVVKVYQDILFRGSAYPVGNSD